MAILIIIAVLIGGLIYLWPHTTLGSGDDDDE